MIARKRSRSGHRRRLATAVLVVGIVYPLLGCISASKRGDLQQRREQNRQSATDDSNVTGPRSASSGSTNIGEGFGDTKSNRLLIWIGVGALAIVAVLSALSSAMGGAWMSNRDRRRFHKTNGGGCVELKMPAGSAIALVEAVGRFKDQQTSGQTPEVAMAALVEAVTQSKVPTDGETKP